MMTYKEALNEYIKATNSHDFNNVRKLLHEDALYWFTDQTCDTLDDIQHYFENAWEVIKDEVYSASSVRWLIVDENSATCVYTYHYEGYYQDEFVAGSGRATNVFIKDESGAWKLKHEHLSSI